MRAKVLRVSVSLLALTVGVALSGAISASSASAAPVGATSDPSALALLHKAEAMMKPAMSALPAVLARTASPLDLYTSSTTHKAAAADGTATMVALARALPSLSPADQTRARAVMGADTSGTGDVCQDNYPTTFNVDTTSDGHFTLYYTLDQSSPDVVTSAYVTQVKAVLENVFSTEISKMGYQAPLSPAGAGNTTPIRLCNIDPSLYGFCAPVGSSATNAFPAACTFRSNYNTVTSGGETYDYYNPSLDGSDRLAPLKVTAAHEFFHAVQFRQNAFATTMTPPLWLMEGTAVWMENEVYPTIHDFLQYLPATAIKNPSVPFNLAVTHDDFDNNPNALWPFTVYADFAYFKFLSGWLHDTSAVKEIWNYLGTHPNAAPLTALKAVLANHNRTLTGMLLNWSIWNTLPPNSYPSRNLYGAVKWWRTPKLDRSKRTFAPAAVSIRSFADEPIVISRGSKVVKGTRLRITITGPSYQAGGYYTYRIRRANGTNTTVTRQIGLHGSAFTLPFNGSITFVAITLNNTATSGTKSFRIRASVL